MEITWTGLLFFPLTLLLLFPSLRLSKILVLTAFCLPFGAVSVVNFSDVPPFFGVGLDRYFTAFLIISVMSFPVVGKIKLERVPNKIKAGFCLFFLTIVASFIVTIYANDIVIWKYFTEPVGSFSKVPLKFSLRNISKTIEILISALFFMSIYKVMPFVSPKRIAKVLILSLFVMGISAFLDFLPGISSVWEVVKNNISYSHSTGIIVGYFGEKRTSGLAIEPSHLIIYTASGLSIMCAFYKNRAHITNRFIDFFLLVFFTILTFLTFSPTMLVVFSLIALYLIYDKKFRGSLKFILILFIFTFIFKEITGNFFEVIIGNALGKMGLSKEYGIYSESRSFSFFAAWDTFLKSPFIGVGWGSFNYQVGFPLFLLGSVGLLGTLVFLFLLILLFRLASKKLINSKNVQEKALREGFILYFSIITVMCLYTKALLYFVHLPTIFFAASMCSDYERKTT